MSLPIRCYQADAVDAIRKTFETVQSSICIMPTGMGKTRTASELIIEFLKLFPSKRIVFLVHRSELAYQARNQIKLAADLDCDIEMGDTKAEESFFNKKPVLISTIQTQCAGKGGGRMLKFNPNDFSLVIVDECHHSTSPSWRKVLDYYKQNPAIKIIGFTATPDRTDEMALGQIFDAVAYDYPLVKAISHGWLVPIVPIRKHLKDLDYSAIKTSCGDLNGADLAVVLEQEKIIQPMVDETVRVIGDQKAIAFLPSVVSSEMFCDIFNRYKPGMAAWVCGETPEIERREILKDFADGKIHVLCNCGICTEGFDAPDVHYVVMCRPTKSRALFCQMIGRGTRALPGILNDYTEDEYYWMRKQVIAESRKPCMFVLEFTGNCGKHKLVTCMNALDGKYPEDVLERAEKKAGETDNKKDTFKLLEEAAKELAQEEIDRIRKKVEAQKLADEARKQHLKPKATYTTSSVNLFDRYDTTPDTNNRISRNGVLSEKQRALLVRDGQDPDKLGYYRGKQALNDLFKKWDNQLCSFKQASKLREYGYKDAAKMTSKAAKEAINTLEAKGWPKPGPDKQDVPEMATA